MYPVAVLSLADELCSVTRSPKHQRLMVCYGNNAVSGASQQFCKHSGGNNFNSIAPYKNVSIDDLSVKFEYWSLGSKSRTTNHINGKIP